MLFLFSFELLLTTTTLTTTTLTTQGQGVDNPKMEVFPLCCGGNYRMLLF